MTDQTQPILGIRCVAVHDVVVVDGKTEEDTIDYYAQDKSGNVWYFGEASEQFQNGRVTGVEGSWLGGVNNAKPGIVMKAKPSVGDFYRQEFSLGVAEDLASDFALGLTVTVGEVT